MFFTFRCSFISTNLKDYLQLAKQAKFRFKYEYGRAALSLINTTINYRVTEMTLSRRGKEHKHDYYVHQGRFVGERNLLDKNDFVCFFF